VDARKMRAKALSVHNGLSNGEKVLMLTSWRRKAVECRCEVALNAVQDWKPRGGRRGLIEDLEARSIRALNSRPTDVHQPWWGDLH